MFVFTMHLQYVPVIYESGHVWYQTCLGPRIHINFGIREIMMSLLDYCQTNFGTLNGSLWYQHYKMRK